MLILSSATLLLPALVIMMIHDWFNRAEDCLSPDAVSFNGIEAFLLVSLQFWEAAEFSQCYFFMMPCVCPSSASRQAQFCFETFFCHQDHSLLLRVPPWVRDLPSSLSTSLRETSDKNTHRTLRPPLLKSVHWLHSSCPTCSDNLNDGFGAFTSQWTFWNTLELKSLNRLLFVCVAFSLSKW